ncbi:hypothetical protein IC582_001961 [Cucumis melo]
MTFVVLKVGEEKEIGKNGLKKKLVKESEGWEAPDTSDEVEVHYTGTLLDGTQFDSNHDQGTSFKFKLGEGNFVCNLMLFNDCKCIVICFLRHNHVFHDTPESIYGEFNSPPTIPPNATLQFDVELLPWHIVKDICQYGGILKNILVKGDGWEKLKDLDEVLVHYEARLESGTLVISKFDGLNSLLKRMDLGNLVAGE